MKYAKTVESYMDSKKEWSDSLHLLREILGSLSMEECIKWGMPTYTYQNKNVAGFSAFKNYVGIWFFQGVFLKDSAGKLINAQEGVTKAQRQWRFSSADEIRNNKVEIVAYLEEAIQNQKDGKEMKAERNKTLVIPDELQEALSANPSLKDSFEALSLSKRRDFAEHIAQAKREETRLQRLEKIKAMILEGIGLYDKYKS